MGSVQPLGGAIAADGVGDLFATLPAERDLIVSQDNSAKGP